MTQGCLKIVNDSNYKSRAVVDWLNHVQRFDDASYHPLLFHQDFPLTARYSTMGDTQSDFIPYRYQDEVFRRAKKGRSNGLRSLRMLTLGPDNVIAALNTGSGKTLISILLIKWIASQDNAKGKAIVFLVPRVTLVDQQAETISKRTPLRVARVFGAMEIDMNNRAGWKKKIENQDVFVMTRMYGSTSSSTTILIERDSPNFFKPHYTWNMEYTKSLAHDF